MTAKVIGDNDNFYRIMILKMYHEVMFGIQKESESVYLVFSHCVKQRRKLSNSVI